MTERSARAVLGGVPRPIRRNLDLTLLAARERRLQLVLEILQQRKADYGSSEGPVPTGLRQSIADFGAQLDDVQRRQARVASGAPAGLAAPRRARRTNSGVEGADTAARRRAPDVRDGG